MKNIDNKNILEELQDLKIGERIFIDININISNTIQLLSLTCQSYENLFSSYINNTCEDANKMNVDNFLKEYSKAYIQIELFKEKMLKEYLGNSYKYFISNQFYYNFDYQLNILSIFKLEKEGK